MVQNAEGLHAMTKPQRHSWGIPSRIPHGIALPRKTERECVQCGIVKTTWHEVDGRCRTEFYRGLDKIEGTSTPVCEVIEKAA